MVNGSTHGWYKGVLPDGILSYKYSYNCWKLEALLGTNNLDYQSQDLLSELINGELIEDILEDVVKASEIGQQRTANENIVGSLNPTNTFLTNMTDIRYHESSERVRSQSSQDGSSRVIIRLALHEADRELNHLHECQDQCTE